MNLPLPRALRLVLVAELGARVHSIEIVPELAKRARKTLDAEGYGQVAVIEGNGWLGLPDEAPFDRILVTAAPDRVPDARMSASDSPSRTRWPAILSCAFFDSTRAKRLSVVDREGRTPSRTPARCTTCRPEVAALTLLGTRSSWTGRDSSCSTNAKR